MAAFISVCVGVVVFVVALIALIICLARRRGVRNDSFALKSKSAQTQCVKYHQDNLNSTIQTCNHLTTIVVCILRTNFIKYSIILSESRW